ncbi:MAG: translocation/assembly module TamB domain-containing protein, partial [Burkholderiaceae bacterium]
ALDTQRITVDLADKTYGIKLNAAIDAAQFRIENARLSVGGAALAASGRLARSGDMAFALQGALDDFNPAQWIGPDARYGLRKTGDAGKTKKTKKAEKTTAPIDADINMRFDASGRLAPQREIKLTFDVHDSRYGKLPMTGGGTLEAVGTRLLPSKARLVVAGNTVDLQGSFGNPGDTLAVQIDAPQIERLGYGLAGALQLDGKVTGTPSRPNVKADWRGARLAFGDQRVTSASGKIDIEGAALDDPNALARAKLDATVDARGVRLPDLALNRLGIDLSGSFGDHTLSLDASGKVHRQPLALSLAAQGSLKKQGDAYAWDGTVRKLENRGVPRLALAAPVELSVAPERVRVGAARMEVVGAQLDLKHLDYDRGRIASEGSLEAIDVKRMLELAQQFTGAKPPVRTDLVLDSRWNFSLTETGSGFAQVERRSGDMIFGTPRGDIRLGLTELAARAELDGQTLKADAHAAARDFGTLTAQGHTTLQQRDGVLTIGPDAPLTATASVSVPRLQPVGALIGPQIALHGKLGMDLAASGTVGDPKLTGTIDGDALSVTLFDLGIQLRDGVVRIAMTPDAIDLKQVEFHGGDGTLRANGRVGLAGGNPDIAATIVAQHLQLFASPDRQLVLSGQAKANNVDQQLHIDGDFTVDRALIDLPPANAPQLGDDVVVVGKEGKRLAAAADTQNGVAKDAAQPTGAFAPVANIGVDLGNDFRFHGAGADLKLAGKMTVHSEPNEPLTAKGTVRVVDGTYSVFGQTLAIERGIVNFTGPIDNPNINILAMRRKQEVEAGVEVTGYAKDPRIQLVSEPSVSDEEKLSWLMFGHGTASSGTGQLNASSAALSYLANQGGSRIAKGIGLDEFSFGASESGLASQQVVTLGKAISERFTVGYEQSLTGAASIAKLTYQLSQRWSVVARAGAINGIEALFDKRFD